MTQSLPVIAIMGPTASGKTGLAIDLAKQLDGEVISVDSALIYRGMDIGTAKPDAEEQDGIPHWLIDTHDPAESYSVSAFFDDAIKHVEVTRSRGKVPILAGGTMMYFNALINGIAPLPQGDSQTKSQIEEEAKTVGWDAMHKQLNEVDPVCGSRIHPNDPQRITRALEVYRLSGRPLSWWQEQPVKKTPFDVHQFAIAPNQRSQLHERIKRRFHKMIALGFKQEVEKLYNRPDLHLNMPAIRSVGYRQMWEHLDGNLSEPEMVERGIIATRQLAKRQLTWLRSWKSLTWLETFDENRLDKILVKVTP